MDQNVDQHFMALALKEAEKAQACDEVPVGAVLVQDGKIVGRGYNQPISLSDPTAHAEIQCLRDAAAHLANYRLPGSTLYVTLEPCSMCAGALVHARVERLVFGAYEPKAGVACSRHRFFEQPWLNSRVTVDGPVLEDECSSLISGFFKMRREQRSKLS